MNPLNLSAQFAAYVWYTEVRQGTKAHGEALRFAEQNWRTFLPSACEGWGKLLMRLARPRRAKSGRLPRPMRGVEKVVRVR
jgi:hypothetical protein